MTTATLVSAMTVPEVLALADRAVTEAAGGDVWVQGEVEGLRQSPAGHLYWTLVGDGARLAVCALCRDARSIVAHLSRAGVTLADGQALRLRGRLGCYPARGTVQLRACAVDPAVTVGGAELARRELRQALTDEGVIDHQQGLRLPLVPQRVWLIGPEGDGVEDFLDVLARSPWAWSVIFVPTISEGTDAPAAISDAIVAAPDETQVIVLARGGGAAATAAYDSETVARAVCAAPVPVITAVGHTSDRSVTDECAWRPMATPSAAAEFLCLCMAEVIDRINTALGAITTAASSSMVRHRAELDRHRVAIDHAVAELAARQQTALVQTSADRARRLVVAVAVLAVALTAIVLCGVLR